jgi:hypothetical protein
MKFRSIVAAPILGSLAVLCAASEARAFELELRVLLVATGGAEADPSRALLEETLDSMGVPYETLDASVEPLTSELLYASDERGRFNGIILTDSETFLPGGGTGLDAEEFALLHEYERTFGVRESIASGFPNRGSSLGLDYGFGDVTELRDVEGRWQGSAGGSELFEYVNTDNTLPIDGFSFAATPRDDGQGPLVEPLLVDAQNPDEVLISRVSYEDGREVLLSTVTNSEFTLHSRVLAYELVNFATSGLFIGARHVYLSIHNDDLFLADATWDPATLEEFPEQLINYRWAAAEVPVVVAEQAAFRERHPLAQNVVIELAFNGIGAAQNDPLTQAVVEHAADFSFINHTFQALQMDRLCTDEGTDCVPTDFGTAFEEISANAEVWLELGLPNPEHAFVSLLTDSHSGIEDRLGTEDIDDDIPFPEGFNQEFGRAAEELGIRLLAGDASRDNQTSIQRVPGRELVLLPRYPTAVFYNVTNPTELVSEYNYIFNGSYLEDGLDPCSAPEAICEPRSYDEILEAEADVTLRHMLAFEPFPHYFHQSNLHVYDDGGSILQFDWLERVLTTYERWLDLPIQSPRFDELADIAWNTVLARELAPAGVLDASTGIVTVVASGSVEIEVTGVSGGAEYGGQSIARVAAGPEGVTLTLDAALDR